LCGVVGGGPSHQIKKFVVKKAYPGEGKRCTAGKIPPDALLALYSKAPEGRRAQHPNISTKKEKIEDISRLFE